MREMVDASYQLGLQEEGNGSQLRRLNDNLVHWWYDFPQDFPSSLIWDKLTQYQVSPYATVLDPFCGSGTTVVTAKMMDLDAVGIEAIDLLAFVTRAKCNWGIPPSSLKVQLDGLTAKIRGLPEKLTCTQHDVENVGMPAETLFRWLPPSTFAEALAVRRLIEEVEDSDIKQFALLAFSKSLYEASNVKYAPGITFLKRKKTLPIRSILCNRLRRMVSDVELLCAYSNTQSHEYGRARVFCDDARNSHELLAPESVDFLITSPPYPGDVEYTRLFRLELYLLGFVRNMKDVQSVKRRMIRGSPKSIFKEDHNEMRVADIELISETSSRIAERVAGKNWGWDYPRLIREYFGDMYVALESFKKVLRPDAYALLVVGDQTVKGVLIPTGEILCQIGEKLGYSECGNELYRYRRSSTHTIPLAENIVILRK